MKAKKYTRCDLAMMGISTYGLAISVWASFGDIPRPLQGRGSLAVAVVGLRIDPRQAGCKQIIGYI